MQGMDAPLPPSSRRLCSLRRQLGIHTEAELATSVPQPTAAAVQQAGAASGLLSDEAVLSFVADGFCMLPNLIETGDITQQACDEICVAARTDSTFSFSNRAELFAQVATNLNRVMASRTVRGGLQSLLGPGYYMPPWNTQLHVNGVGDQYVPGHTGFHADGTDHGPTQSTTRDHRSRQIFGFFYPGDVPTSHGPTSIMPKSQYKTVDRIHSWNHLHEVNSEDLITLEELPAHLQPDHRDDTKMDEAAFAPVDEHRMRVAAEVLGEPRSSLEENKLVCRAGTVVLVHHDVFHRSTRRLPEAWRPLFVLRDCVRMTEPVSGMPSWNSTSHRRWPELPDGPRSPKIAALHDLNRTFWRYLCGIEDREAVPPLDEHTLGRLVETVTKSRADIDRVAAAYALGRTQQREAVLALIGLLSHSQEATRRAAGYGLTVGGAAAVAALLPLLDTPPTIPPRVPHVPANVDEQAAALPPIAHAITQLAANACSMPVVEALVRCSQRAKEEIKCFEQQHPGKGPTDRPDDYEYFVIHRRRCMVECNFALGHIGQVAASRNNVEICVAACRALIGCVCDRDGEPGRRFTSYMTILRVTHSAITNLIRLGSTPRSAAATPLRWHGAPNNLVPESWSAGEQAESLTGPPPRWALDGPTGASMRSMVGEAAWRLRAACASSDPDEANEARSAMLRLLEAASWPGFELPLASEPSAFVHHEPLLS